MNYAKMIEKNNINEYWNYFSSNDPSQILTP